MWPRPSWGRRSSRGPFAWQRRSSGPILGFEAFKQSTRIAWICGVGSIVAIVVGISFLGFQGAIGGLVVGELIRCALTVLLARQIMRQNGLQLLGRADLREVKILWQFSLPLLLTSVLFASITWFCQGAIARQPDGLTEIGLYDAAQKCMSCWCRSPHQRHGSGG